jgi:hypothetical protein
MGSISKPNTFSASTTISSSEVNDNFDTIYNEFNGSISAANLATGAVTTAKIADSNVTTAKINDSAVTAAKINFGGSGSGVWWEEIGRNTLTGVADTITVSSLPARKYLKVLVYLIDTGGTITGAMTFNSDTANNYAFRYSTDGAADLTSTSTSSISVRPSTAAAASYSDIDIVNFSTEPKLVTLNSIQEGTSGAANAPNKLEMVGKWQNTSAQISSITLTNGGTGDYATGSAVIVLGHD